MKYGNWTGRKGEILERMDTLYEELAITEEKTKIKEELNSLSQEFQRIAGAVPCNPETTLYDKAYTTTPWIGETTKQKRNRK